MSRSGFSRELWTENAAYKWAAYIVRTSSLWASVGIITRDSGNHGKRNKVLYKATSNTGKGDNCMLSQCKGVKKSAGDTFIRLLS